MFAPKPERQDVVAPRQTRLDGTRVSSSRIVSEASHRRIAKVAQEHPAG